MTVLAILSRPYGYSMPAFARPVDPAAKASNRRQPDAYLSPLSGLKHNVSSWNVYGFATLIAARIERH